MALARRSPPLTRRAATPAARRARGPRRRAAARAAADNDNNNTSNNDVSDAFSRELRRRGVGSSEGDESREAFLERPSEEEPAERDERMFGQLERTRQMQSEGLEGLPGRAKELLTLGVFSNLSPQLLWLGAAITGATVVLQMALGGEFIHGADPELYDIPLPDDDEAFQKYYNPYEELKRPTFDPMVPLD